MTQEVHSQKNEMKTYVHKKMCPKFALTLFTIASNLEIASASINRIMDKQLVGIHLMKHFSTIKRNKLWIHTSTYMNLKTLCKSQKPYTKNTYHMVLFLCKTLYGAIKFFSNLYDFIAILQLLGLLVWCQI